MTIDYIPISSGKNPLIQIPLSKAPQTFIELYWVYKYD
jgi:hypothetical protein